MSKTRWDRVCYVWLVLGLIFFNVGCQEVARAGGGLKSPSESLLSERRAIHAIINEASPGVNQAEYRALAWAIANRGTFQGVYGLNRPLRATTAQLEAAKQAWRRVGGDNHGGNHFLSDWDLKHAKPHLIAFRFKMTEVLHVGAVHFYRS